MYVNFWSVIYFSLNISIEMVVKDLFRFIVYSKIVSQKPELNSIEFYGNVNGTSGSSYKHGLRVALQRGTHTVGFLSYHVHLKKERESIS
jgi:hypothetical protein